MSHRAISSQQFGTQLPLFMHTDDIVDKLDKGDSAKRKWTPREQWERPGSAEGYAGFEEHALVDKKQADLVSGGSHHESFNRRSHRPETMPPVELYHSYPGKRPTLTEGHHRLAWAQMKGISYLAVEHSIPDPDTAVLLQAASERRRGKKS